MEAAHFSHHCSPRVGTGAEHPHFAGTPIRTARPSRFPGSGQHVPFPVRFRGSASPSLPGSKAAHPVPTRDGDQGSTSPSLLGMAIRAAHPSPSRDRSGASPFPAHLLFHRIPFPPLLRIRPASPPTPKTFRKISGSIPDARHSPSKGSSKRSAGRRSAMMGCAEQSPAPSLRNARPGGAARGRGVPRCRCCGNRDGRCGTGAWHGGATEGGGPRGGDGFGSSELCCEIWGEV